MSDPRPVQRLQSTGAPSSTSAARGRRLGRLASGLLVLALVGLIGAMSRPVAAADRAGVTMAAEIPLVGDPYGANYANEVMLDSSARRVVFMSTALHRIRSYDLDTFRPAAEVSYSSVNSNSPWALDPPRHILFHFDTIDETAPVVVGIDTRTLRKVLSLSLPPMMGDPSAGFYWSPRDGLLYILFGPSPQPQSARSSAIAAVDPYAAGQPVLWTSPLPGCGAPLAEQSNNASPLGETSDGRYLIGACAATQGSAEVLRFHLPPDSSRRTPAPGGTYQGAVDEFPGLVTGAGADSQWIPGVDRLVTMVQSNGGAGWSAYVFDARSLHFVTAPGLFNPPSTGHVSYASYPPTFGFDAGSGRVVAQSRALATDGRDPLTGQPCQFYADQTDQLAVMEANINGVSVLHFPVPDPGVDGQGHFAGYDPVRHNWWMLSQHYSTTRCNPEVTQDASYFVVFHDSLPPAESPPSADPDALTSNILEQPGVTGANPESDASAYGVHYVLGPSGADGVVAEATFGGNCDLNAEVQQKSEGSNLPLAVPDAPPAPPQYHAFCNSHGRMATFAHVDHVSLDGSEARADAITGDTDRETAGDLATGTDYSRPGLYINAASGYANSEIASQAGGAGQPTPSPLPPPCPTSTPPPPAPTPTPTPLLALPAPPGEPTTCDQQLRPVQPFVTGVALPYAPAHCGDNGSGLDQDSTQAPLEAHGVPSGTPLSYPGSATVICSFDQHLAQGYAEQANSSAAGPLDYPVAAKSATASARAERSTTAGATAVATSTVEDISVGGLLHIGKLTATATTAAHGRPGTNAPGYTCTITDLALTPPASVTLPSSASLDIPGSVACDDPRVQTALGQLNTILQGQLNIVFPPASRAEDAPPGGEAAVVQRMSPGGYLSQVALSDLDQGQQAILVNDTSIEFPAMVVTLYLDNSFSRNRLIASFAGVAAASRYGIFDLGSSGDDAAANDSGIGPPEAGIVNGQVGAPPGGVPPVEPPAMAAPSSALGGSFNLGQVAHALVDGFRLLLQHPEMIPPLLVVWLLLASPGYMFSRRRSMLTATGRA